MFLKTSKLALQIFNFIIFCQFDYFLTKKSRRWAESSLAFRVNNQDSGTTSFPVMTTLDTSQ
jgi:hypothetical protein